MCDDMTDAENERWLVGRRDVVRGLSTLGLGASAIGLPGCTSDLSKHGPDRTALAAPIGSGAQSPAATSAPLSASLAKHRVLIPTPDGKADAYFVTPNAGNHPGVLVWPDVAGLREAYETMGARLAERGYAVLVVNQYYRSAAAPIVANFAEWRTDAGKAKLKPMIEALSSEATTRDATAMVAWLDAQPQVDKKRKIGTSGYCMGGPFAIRTAAAVPSRVGAAASFHGANLATDKPDSPHLLFAKTQATFLIAIAKNDDERDADAKVKLRAAADAAQRPAEVEVYAAQHGFCTIDAPVYDKPEAERAWTRLLATFEVSL